MDCSYQILRWRLSLYNIAKRKVSQQIIAQKLSFPPIRPSCRIEPLWRAIMLWSGRITTQVNIFCHENVIQSPGSKLKLVNAGLNDPILWVSSVPFWPQILQVSFAMSKETYHTGLLQSLDVSWHCSIARHSHHFHTNLRYVNKSFNSVVVLDKKASNDSKG